ncbi:NAD-dependent epimerase/dehydratase family protein [Streptomyces sp. NPDC052236]|uniref:NAD-dependent epimerase/dehydratase family protein n=1 Tax=Streptomyces sp. NPDC052236 TaxID=3365686 RepID=UPI0037CF828B
MKYLVTGATGFVGLHLVRHLLERGHTVAALVRDQQGPARTPPAVRVLYGDLATGHGLRAAVDEASGTDCVLHLAGTVMATRPDGYAPVNAHGTRLLCEALAELETPPRLVYCSSLAAAGPSLPGRPRRETDPPRPVSAYGRSKLAGERALHAMADRVPGVIVRPPIVYGPGDTQFLPTVLAMVRGGALLTCGTGPRQYSLIHVDDLCHALLAAAERGATVQRSPSPRGVYHVSDGVHHRYEDIGAAVAAWVGRRPPRIVPVPRGAMMAAAWSAELAARVRDRPSMFARDKIRELCRAAWTCTTEQAARELGFTAAVVWPTGLTDALRPT